MDEYISREDVLKKAKSSISVPADNEWDCGYNTAMAEMQEFIKQLPATDVQPAKHGQWIIADDVEHFIAICSECGRIEDSRAIKDMLYCHCGARMDGEKK